MQIYGLDQVETSLPTFYHLILTWFVWLRKGESVEMLGSSQ